MMAEPPEVGRKIDFQILRRCAFPSQCAVQCFEMVEGFLRVGLCQRGAAAASRKTRTSAMRSDFMTVLLFWTSIFWSCRRLQTSSLRFLFNGLASCRSSAVCRSG